MSGALPIEHEVLLQHTEWVRALARSLVSDPNMADDLAQEACVVALERPPEARGNLRSWLATVLRSLIRQERRGAARRVRRERAVARAESAPALEVVERASTHRMLVEALMDLDEPFRMTLLLRYFEGLAPREIAERLDVPLDTVRSRLRRGLGRMRERLDRTESGGQRGAWMALLAPLVETTHAGPAPASALLGGIAMKKALVAIAFVTVLGVWIVPGMFDEAERQGLPAASPGATELVAEEEVARPELPMADVRVAVEAQGPTPEAEEPASAPSTMLLDGLVLDVTSLPVVGLALSFTPTNGAATPLISGPGGRFSVTVPASEGRVRAADDRYTTVLVGECEPGAGLEPVVVVARRLKVAGRVVDGSGAPVPGARVLYRVPRDYQRHLTYVLDASHEPEFRTRADERGAFAFDSVPAIAGARIVAEQDGYERGETPVPEIDDRAVEVVVRKSEPSNLTELHGRVVDRAGDPVPGARVSAALEIVITGADGTFTFDGEVAAETTEIVAVHVGHLPARLRASVTPDGSVWPGYVELRLGDEPLEMRGRVVDEDGNPVAGARVIEEDSVAHVESVLAGIRSKEEVARSGDSLRDTPSSLWTWVTTDDQGRFRLAGLLDREYRLRAMDPASLVLVDEGPFHAADAHVVLVLPVRRGTSAVAGTVLASDGTPIAGASVRVHLRAFTTRVGENRRVSWDRSGPETTTDEEGRFALPPVAREGVSLYVSSPGLHGKKFFLGRDVDPEAVLIRMGPEDERSRCHFQVQLDDPELADRFALLAADGDFENLVVRRSGSAVGMDESDLVDGRSFVLSAREGSYRLVLYRAGVEVRREWVTLAPGDVVLLRF